MFCYINKPSNQKDLYFALNRAMQNEGTQKIRGVYVIFKNDICLYVGQSENIPSRLATHMCGKYETATRIIVFEDIDEADLIESEKYMIKEYKPIENILADYTCNIDIKKTMGIIHDIELGADESVRGYFEYEILIERRNLFISDRDCLPDIYAMDKNIKKTFIDTLKASGDIK